MSIFTLTKTKIFEGFGQIEPKSKKNTITLVYFKLENEVIINFIKAYFKQILKL